ncbi:hypothetical protein ACE1SV_71850 [Streptomyces sp. E-15]
MRARARCPQPASDRYRRELPFATDKLDGASDHGRAALAGLDETGASPEAQAGASAILAEEIKTGPRLRHELALHLSPPHATGDVVIDRSRMRGDNPILVGSGTIDFKKPTSAAGMVALVLAVPVVLAVIVLAVYGGSRIPGSDDSADSRHGSASAAAGENDDSTSTPKIPKAKNQKRHVSRCRGVVIRASQPPSNGPIGDDLYSLDAVERAQALMQLVCDRAVASQNTR